MHLANVHKEIKMYNNKLVATLKVNGKVLREDGDMITIPFDTEYSLYLKNLESKKVLVNIEIDGEDVLDGNQLVINGNSSMELEGFMRGSTAKNKFKFIEKTKQIEEFRGNRIDDSLIRIEYRFEQDEPTVITTIYETKQFPYWYQPVIRYGDWNYTYGNNTVDPVPSGRGTSSFSVSTASIGSQEPLSVNCYNHHDGLIQDGITVKGTEIEQDFKCTYVGNLENQSYTMILKLKGFKTNDKKVSKPVFVKDKIICCVCGTKNSYSNKYCTNCGAFLEK